MPRIAKIPRSIVREKSELRLGALVTLVIKHGNLSQGFLEKEILTHKHVKVVKAVLYFASVSNAD